MTTNFKIKSFTEIDFHGRHVDLHNNFSFRPTSFDQNDNEIKIYFDKANGDWVPKDEFSKLTFTLSKIKYLKTTDRDPKYFADDHCLAGITYFYPNDREENYGLLEKAEPSPGDDIIFSFESDRVIRVNCASVILTVE